MEDNEMKDKFRTEMVGEYQCPGCINGSNPDCPKFELQDLDPGFRCSNHLPGTMVMGGPGPGVIYLGLPSPFSTMSREGSKAHLLALASNEEGKRWLESDPLLNIPVWKMKHEDCTLVRIARPGSCRFTTLVVDGDLEVSGAADVGETD